MEAFIIILVLLSAILGKMLWDSREKVYELREEIHVLRKEIHELKGRADALVEGKVAETREELEREFSERPYSDKKFENLEFRISICIDRKDGVSTYIQLGRKDHSPSGKDEYEIQNIIKVRRDHNGRVTDEWLNSGDRWEKTEEFVYGCEESRIPTEERYLDSGRYAQTYVIPKKLCLTVTGYSIHDVKEITYHQLDDDEESVLEKSVRVEWSGIERTWPHTMEEMAKNFDAIFEDKVISSNDPRKGYFGFASYFFPNESDAAIAAFVYRKRTEVSIDIDTTRDFLSVLREYPSNLLGRRTLEEMLADSVPE